MPRVSPSAKSRRPAGKCTAWPLAGQKCIPCLNKCARARDDDLEQPPARVQFVIGGKLSPLQAGNDVTKQRSRGAAQSRRIKSPSGCKGDARARANMHLDAKTVGASLKAAESIVYRQSGGSREARAFRDHKSLAGRAAQETR